MRLLPLRFRSTSPLAFAATRNADNTIVLIRLRQSQHFLRDVTQDELRADGRDPRDHDFAQVALDVKFLRIAETAMRHHGLLAGAEPRLACKVLRGVR